MAIKVKYNSPDEFIQEMQRDHSLIFRQIVRFTHLFETKSDLPIKHLYAVATYHINQDPGQNVELRHYCGQLWHIGGQDEKTKDHAEAIELKIRDACASLGLEVRSGIID